MGLYNSKVLFDWLLCRRELIYRGAYTCGNNKISNFNLAISTFHVQQSKFCFCAKIQVENIPWGGGGGGGGFGAYNRCNNKIKNCMGL